MDGPFNQVYVVYVHPEILRRKEWLYYLTPPDPWGRLKDVIKAPIDERFYAVAARYMNAFLEKGEMPPLDIAPAIFNMLDDYAAGRQVAIRTGDYIALQTHVRANKDL